MAAPKEHWDKLSDALREKISDSEHSTDDESVHSTHSSGSGSNKEDKGKAKASEIVQQSTEQHADSQNWRLEPGNSVKVERSRHLCEVVTYARLL